MAQKPEIAQQPRRILNERGEQIKEPVYMAPPNPTKPTKK
ncbi:hypothetical protein psyc5s11_53500 [Clostridium gelidum]|uniref:Uncharacterized protein n=1 Tax=Clostridium gelidum TaxID=704125 RepID=A0ABN6J783_9CLOT|nr:hypothetical protein psyc5s11_53500 [Clostridium gelidum]